MVNLRALLALSVPFVGGETGASLSVGSLATPVNVECVTTKGNFIVQVHHDWAPLGASHFLALVADNFFTDIALFRCVPKFLAQFGISADPAKKHWHNEVIADDPHGDEMRHGLKKYQVSYAGSGKHSRSTHLFVAYEDLPGLGKSDWEGGHDLFFSSLLIV
jgi:cyclophilin family peptidyl-prolyl cis-trans isomerase